MKKMIRKKETQQGFFKKLDVFIIEHEPLISGILFFIALFFISFKIALIITLFFGIVLTALSYVSVNKWRVFELQSHHLDFEVLENEL
jgi:hypothetical protein